MLDFLQKSFDKSSLIIDNIEDSPFIVKGEYVDPVTGNFYTYSRFTVKHHELIFNLPPNKQGIALFLLCVRRDGRVLSVSEIENMDYEVFCKIINKIV
jgi:hypothetical protein